MAEKTWNEIITSEDYKSLPTLYKIVMKQQYWKNTISKSDKFQGTGRDQQKQVEQWFFSNKPEEDISFKKLTEEAPANKALIKGLQLWSGAIENIAKFVEPEVPAGRTTLGLMTKDLPRQIGAEFLRVYKPETLIPFHIASKIAKPVLKPAGKYIWKKTPEGLKRVLLKEFTIGKGQPLAYQEAAKQAQLEKVAGAREATDVAKVLTTKPTGEVLTREEQRYVGRIFRKEVIESPALKAHPKYQQLKQISDSGRAIMDKWSKALIESGIPSKEAQEVIEGNVGKYMARMYTTKLEKTGTRWGWKELRLRLSGLKHRKDLSEAVLKQLGEIKEPALPTAIRVKELSTSVANNKLFNIVANNPEWVASSNIGGKLIQMPKTASLGVLKGKWVIPEIANDINAITSIQTQNIALQAYSKALSAWKYGKVVLNPATQVRNMLSNTILLDLSGTNHLRQAQLFPRITKDYLQRGTLYQQALKDGAIGGEFVGTEVARIRDYYLQSQGGNLTKWLNIVKMPFQKAGNFYQGVEQIAKMIKYVDVLEKGGTRKVAAEAAQKWLFNYNEIPNFIKVAKQVSPFITFCVSADTQILTNKGWRFFDEIKNEDETLAYQVETGQLKWQKIKEVSVFPYNGDMLHIKSRSLDILMTPDHRNIVLHRNKKELVRKIKLAKELNSRDSVIVAGNYIAPEHKIITDDMVQLVGWFVTEGYIVTCSRAFCIGQTNKKGQEEIELLRKRLKIDKYNIQSRRYKLGGYKLHKVYYFPSFIRDRVLKLAPNKTLTTGFLRKLTKEQLQMLYDVLLLADGCNTGSSPVLIQNPGETADNIQILGVMLGRQFGWSIKENCLAITVTSGKTRQLKRNLPQQVDYQGMVWCPQTDYGTWVARRNGKVFITGNTYKALPRIAETITENPLRVYKYYALARAWNEASHKLMGMSPEEYARQKKALPPWLAKSIGGMPANLLMPWKDKYGRTQWLNLEYILPIGLAPEIMEQGILKGGFTNPFYRTLSDLEKNMDFRGRPIVPIGATKGEAIEKTIEYIYRQLAPSLAPSILGIKGGYSWEKTMDAIQKRPDFAERTRDLTPVLFDVLVGLKLNALDVDESERFKMYEKQQTLLELQKQALKLNHPAISEKERQRGIENIFKKMQKVLERN